MNDSVTTVKKVYESKCPKCGNLQYVVGRDINTGDIMCRCHEVRTDSPVFKGWEQK
jgi:predicted nucleic-acid-binding Zn-ribbon protein